MKNYAAMMCILKRKLCPIYFLQVKQRLTKIRIESLMTGLIISCLDYTRISNLFCWILAMAEYHSLLLFSIVDFYTVM